jgi:hypothetical protein
MAAKASRRSSGRAEEPLPTMAQKGRAKTEAVWHPAGPRRNRGWRHRHLIGFLPYLSDPSGSLPPKALRSGPGKLGHRHLPVGGHLFDRVLHLRQCRHLLGDHCFLIWPEARTTRRRQAKSAILPNRPSSVLRLGAGLAQDRESMPSRISRACPT